MIKRPLKSITILLLGLSTIMTAILCASCFKESNYDQILKSEALIQTIVEKRVPLEEPSLGSCENTGKYELDDSEYCYWVSYDRHGNKLEDGYCDEVRGFDYTYEYDSNGDIIKSFWYTWGSHDLEITHIYKYDSQGRVIERISQPSGQWFPDSEFRNTMRYDEIGNLIEVQTFNEERGLIGKWTGDYDGKKLIQSASCGYDGTMYSKIHYKYNENGEKIESITYDFNRSLTYRANYKYDNHGDMIESNTYDGNDSTAMHEVYENYEFDENGQWTKRIVKYELYNTALVWGVDCGTVKGSYAEYRTITYYHDN